MRMLFTFVGGRGHFEPLAPLAAEARARGHAVAFGCAPSSEAMVVGAGFDSQPLGPLVPERSERLPLRAVDRERERRELVERFVLAAAPARAVWVRELVGAWRPDVVVCDETDFGAMLAAERCRVRCASVLVIAAGAFASAAVVGEALGKVRERVGLPRDPSLATLHRDLVLSPFPPSFRDPAHPLPDEALSFSTGTARASGTPAWCAVRPGRPADYFTLGTIFNTESGALLASVVSGLRELPINLLVASGPGLDPTELGAQPAHVCVERHVDPAAVLPHCAAVVSHGGSGTVAAALAHGIPQLLIPLGADQPDNADRCRALGVARVLDAVQLTPSSVAGAVAALLVDREAVRRSSEIRDEIAALPRIDAAVDALESLA